MCGGCQVEHSKKYSRLLERNACTPSSPYASAERYQAARVGKTLCSPRHGVCGHFLVKCTADVQAIEKHDVREAIDILVEDGDERWREQVEAWGAVYEEKAMRCARAGCCMQEGCAVSGREGTAEA